MAFSAKKDLISSFSRHEVVLFMKTKTFFYLADIGRRWKVVGVIPNSLLKEREK